MSVLEISKIYPGRPPIGRQAQNVIFFLQIRNEVPGEKKGGPVAPPTGDPFFFQGPILSYSSVYSSSSSARSRPLTPTARNLSFIKSREKIA